MRPWLFRIAHNEAVSALRRRRPTTELSSVLERGSTSIEDEGAERAELSVLLRDLRELTDHQRSALVLRELNDLSHQEIALALGTSVGGAKQTIFEARRSLFEFAEGRAMACDEIRRTISDADGRVLRSRRIRAHLRECSGCAAFAAAIPARAGELRALAPALPVATAGGLVDRIALSGAVHHGGSSFARLAAAATAKAGTAGAGFGANAMAGVAVVASATLGVTVGVGKIVHAMAHAEASRGGTHAAVRAPARHPQHGHPASSLSAGAPRAARSALIAPAAAAGTNHAARTTRHGWGAAHGRGDLGSHAAETGRPAWAQAPAGATTHGSSTSEQHGHGATHAAGHAGHGKPAWASQGKSSSASTGSSNSTHSASHGSDKGAGPKAAKPAPPGAEKSAQAKSGKSAGTDVVGVDVSVPTVTAPGSATALAHRHN